MKTILVKDFKRNLHNFDKKSFQRNLFRDSGNFNKSDLTDFEEDTYSRIFSALRHPVRRMILRILSDGKIQYTGLLNRLQVTTGFLNYHLENMGDLIAKNDEGHYHLTTFGEAALNLISNVEMSQKTIESQKLMGRIKFFAVFIIVILILSNIFLFVNFNRLSSKESSILVNVLAENRNLTNKMTGILNATVAEEKIDFLTQRNLLEYAGELSANYDEIVQLIDPSSEKLTQIKFAADDLRSFLNDWNNVYMTYLILKNNYNYNNITRIQVDSLRVLNKDLMELNKVDLIGSNNEPKLDEVGLNEVYNVMLKLQVDVELARSAFYTGTFQIKP